MTRMALAAARASVCRIRGLGRSIHRLLAECGVGQDIVRIKVSGACDCELGARGLGSWSGGYAAAWASSLVATVTFSQRSLTVLVVTLDETRRPIGRAGKGPCKRNARRRRKRRSRRSVTRLRPRKVNVSGGLPVTSRASGARLLLRRA